MEQERDPDEVAARPAVRRAPSWAEQVRQARERVLAGRTQTAERRKRQREREAQQGKPQWLEE